jgi:hypothetical protein
MMKYGWRTSPNGASRKGSSPTQAQTEKHVQTTRAASRKTARQQAQQSIFELVHTGMERTKNHGIFDQETA